LRKVQRSGKLITPNQKKKSSNKDAKVISGPEIIVSKPDTIISGFDTIVSGFEIRNRSGHEYLYILTKKTFIPTRWQNISNKKCPTFKVQAKPSAFIGYRPVLLLVPYSLNNHKVTEDQLLNQFFCVKLSCFKSLITNWLIEDLPNY